MESVAEKLLLKDIDKASWQLHRFDQIAKNISERVEPTQTDLEIYVGLEHIDSESLHIKRFGKREDVSGTKLRCYPGDIIFGRRRAYQRKAAIMEFNGFCSAHSLVLRANSKVITPKLFPFFLHSDAFMHRAVDISVGSLSPTINWGDLKKQEFLLPPLEQQEQLAELLWAGDELLCKYGKVLDSSKLLYAGISGKVFSKDVKNYLNELPFNFGNVSWADKNLEEVCVLITDGAHASPKTDNSGKPIGTVENMLDDSIDIKSCRKIGIQDFENLKRNNCQPIIGDVLFSKDGTIGRTFVFNQPEELILLSSIAIIRTKEDELLPEYCSLMFESPVFVGEIEKWKSGTALKRIVLKDIKKFNMLIPELNFRRKVSDTLLKIKAEKKKLNILIKETEQLQKFLISQIF